MRFFPQGDSDLKEMLAAVGVASVAELFGSVPEKLRLRDHLDLPARHSEETLRRRMRRLAGENASAATHSCFLGAGAYNHTVPAAVSQLLLRSEFYTTYTPYQPEISQGTLQAIFEYQSLIASLTELEVSNASLYDGASALAEGILMAQRAVRKPVVLLSSAVHPHYVQVVKTYVRNMGLEVVMIPTAADGRTDTAKLETMIGGMEPCAVAVQSPNFFGCFEDLDTIVALSKSRGAMAEVVVTDPVALGLVHGPGHHGADVAVGEAQAFGTPLQFGGPFLGFMAAREALMRQMPGRLVGEATDAEGRRGYVLTLATREQHIRRERATSNICTNQGLIALAATIAMSLMGKEGIRETAIQCHSKAVWARERLSRVRGCRPRFDAPFFHEFVLDLPGDPQSVNTALLERGIIGGLPLGSVLRDASMERSMLFCLTELNTREEIETLANSLEEILP